MKGIRRLFMWAALLPGLAMAQAQQDVPLRLGYQGRLLKSDGTPLTGLQPVTFSLYTASTGGTAIWAETQQVALTNGFYATFLGATTPLGTTTTPSSSVFSGADLYLGVTVAGSELKPRQRLGSVAYAFRAAQAVEAMHAARATNADSASNASYATNAGHATNADNAANATNAQMAAHATYSDNGGHATAADNAANATNVSGGGTVTANQGTFGNLTVSGQVTGGIIPGRVVGGYYTYSVPTSGTGNTIACAAWGDARCTPGDCHGGSNTGTPRNTGAGILCIQ